MPDKMDNVRSDIVKSISQILNRQISTLKKAEPLFFPGELKPFLNSSNFFRELNEACSPRERWEEEYFNHCGCSKLLMSEAKSEFC